MKEFVGVKSWMTIPGQLTNCSSLKQDALFFRQIAFVDSDISRAFLAIHKGLLEEIEWLVEQQIIIPYKLLDAPSLLEDDHEYVQLLNALDEIRGAILQFAKEENNSKSSLEYLNINIEPTPPTKELKEALEFFAGQLLSSALEARIASIQLRRERKIDAVPILDAMSEQIPTQSQFQADKVEVIQLILKTLPLPDDLTPWEHILEYREDPATQHLFIDLRNWMNEVARAKLTPTEVESKLEYLTSQFQRHMSLHKMKANTGFFETLIVTPAEIAEDLVKFKWGKLAKSLFSVKQRKIALLEGELKSHGSEVAYIVRTRERFARN